MRERERRKDVCKGELKDSEEIWRLNDELNRNGCVGETQFVVDCNLQHH